MTSFFDDATHAITELHADDALRFDGAYLDAVAAIEKPVVDCIMLNTGDREFPDDLRQKILGIVATKCVYNPAHLAPLEATKREVLATRHSPGIEALHSAFHELARRRAPARWGCWSDSPRQNLVSRDDTDGGNDADRFMPKR